VRRPGRPSGQDGVALEQVAVADVEVGHEPEVCACCGAGLAGRPETGRERRQVIDLPEIAPKVTEHQLVSRRCGCGHVTKALAPVGAAAPVQYGPRISALAVGPWHGQFLAKARVAEVMGTVFGAPMAPGTVASNNTAEREIRMCRLRIKVSGSMRSMRGAEEFCRIRSYLQTTKKHGTGWLDALTDAMRGIPWMPETATA